MSSAFSHGLGQEETFAPIAARTLRGLFRTKNRSLQSATMNAHVGDDHVTYWVPAGCLMLRRCLGAIRQSASAHLELKQIQPAA